MVENRSVVDDRTDNEYIWPTTLRNIYKVYNYNSNIAQVDESVVTELVHPAITAHDHTLPSASARFA
jgi:hypothetical protein